MENVTAKYQSPEFCCVNGAQLRSGDGAEEAVPLEQQPSPSPPSTTSQNRLNWGAGLGPHWGEGAEEPGLSFGAAEDPLQV